MKKGKYKKMTIGEIDGRKEWLHSQGYKTSKWLEFCEYFMNKQFSVYYYVAKKTVSKYVQIKRGKKKFLVRFSNHKPIEYLERKGTCDFFVGVTNLGVTNTKNAINATEKFFS